MNPAERRFNALMSQLTPRLQTVASALASVDIRDQDQAPEACQGHCDMPAAAGATATSADTLPLFASVLPIEGAGAKHMFLSKFCTDRSLLRSQLQRVDACGCKCQF